MLLLTRSGMTRAEFSAMTPRQAVRRVVAMKKLQDKVRGSKN